ncbi:GM19297 [Drosophila sechellia]|uniref:GM19297 n=1 Tax=Drosophila sechellia TaxID=7238 RepID=B4INB1_DROSE|nr:GM19297 [Drosophila sechellia]
MAKDLKQMRLMLMEVEREHQLPVAPILKERARLWRFAMEEEEKHGGVESRPEDFYYDCNTPTIHIYEVTATRK